MATGTPRVTRLTAIAVTLTGAVVAGTAGFLVTGYQSLHPIVPVHFARGGLPDRWVMKSWSLVMMPVAIQLALAVTFGAVIALLLWRAAPGAAGAMHQDEEDHGRRMRATAEGIALLSLVWIAFQGLASVQLMALWERGGGGLGRVYAVGLLAAIAMSIAIGVRSMRAVGRSQGRAADDSPHWRLKVLYVNRHDPRLFVPARVGIGYTLNFGRGAAVTLLALVLLVGVGLPVVIIKLLIR